MFKKMLNKYNLTYLFFKSALFAILMFLVPITLYLSTPQIDTYKVIHFERALMMIENIVCAFSLTIAFGLVIMYEEKKVKKINK